MSSHQDEAPSIQRQSSRNTYVPHWDIPQSTTAAAARYVTGLVQQRREEVAQLDNEAVATPYIADRAPSLGRLKTTPYNVYVPHHSPLDTEHKYTPLSGVAEEPADLHEEKGTPPTQHAPQANQAASGAPSFALYATEEFGDVHPASSHSSDELDDASGLSPLSLTRGTSNLKKGIQGSQWNEYFQSLLELNEITVDNTNKKYQRLAQLSQDFVDIAKTYGKIIISEFHLPDHSKTIPPADLGGTAGGQKYIVRGILFKLAQDKPTGVFIDGQQVFVYGGKSGADDEFAQKAAGHDLKGAVNYLNFLQSLRGINKGMSTQVPRVPMQALVDYRGFRLIAMPLLPLQKLVYGSNDGGQTVHSTDPNDVMSRAANYLHLGAHKVKNTMLHSAADVELHFGDDGRYYLLDLARTFPPESPQDCPHLLSQGAQKAHSHSVFYRLLRPEFLQLRKSRGFPALSPDALTGFSKGQPDSHLHNREISEATRYLVETVVPSFARFLDDSTMHPASVTESANTASRDLQSTPDTPLMSGQSMQESGTPSIVLREPISEEVHKRGINMRHIGLLRCLVKRNKQARAVLLIEAVARTLKNVLRLWLRQAMRDFKRREPSEFLVRLRIVTLLNLVSGSHNNSSHFYRYTLLPGLQDRFGVMCLDSDEQRVRPDGTTGLEHAIGPFKLRVIKHLLNMTGVSLTPMCMAECARAIEGFNFTISDVLDSDVKVTHMSIMDYARAKFLVNQADARRVSSRTLRFYDLAVRTFASALRSDTLHLPAVKEQCLTRSAVAELSRRYADADWMMLSNTNTVLRRGELGVGAYDVAVAFLSQLLDLWEHRRSADQLPSLDNLTSTDATSTRSFSNIGGASSLRALLYARHLLKQIRDSVNSFADDSPAAGAGLAQGITEVALPPQPSVETVEKSPALPANPEDVQLAFADMAVSPSPAQDQGVLDLIGSDMLDVSQLELPDIGADDVAVAAVPLNAASALHSGGSGPSRSISAASASVQSGDADAALGNKSLGDPQMAAAVAHMRVRDSLGVGSAGPLVETGSLQSTPTTSRPVSQQQALSFSSHLSRSEREAHQHVVDVLQRLESRLTTTFQVREAMLRSAFRTLQRAWKSQDTELGGPIVVASVDASVSANSDSIPMASPAVQVDRAAEDEFVRIMNVDFGQLEDQKADSPVAALEEKKSDEKVQDKLPQSPSASSGLGPSWGVDQRRQRVMKIAQKFFGGLSLRRWQSLVISAVRHLAEASGHEDLDDDVGPNGQPIKGSLLAQRTSSRQRQLDMGGTIGVLQELFVKDKAHDPDDIALFCLFSAVEVDETSEKGKRAYRMVKGLLRANVVDVNAVPSAGDGRNWTCLMVAAKGKPRMVSQLLRARADPNIRRAAEGDTALIKATQLGHAECMRVLLAGKADPNIADQFGRTPLIWGARYGLADAVKVLVARGCGTDPNLRDNKGYTALMTSAHQGNLQVARAILGSELDTPVDLTVRDERNGYNALFLASANASLPVVEVLLQASSDPKFHCNTRALVNAGSTANETSLITAAQKGLANIVRLLLSHGADPAIYDRTGQNAMMKSCRMGRTRVIQVLLDDGKVDPNLQDEEHFRTPLMAAASEGHVDAVRLLLSSGALPDLQALDKETALLAACRYGHRKVAAVLLEHKSDLSPCDASGRNALAMALINGHRKLAALLLTHLKSAVEREEATAICNTADRQGNTPLHHAALRNHRDIAKQLLTLGASPLPTNKDNKTPGQLADKDSDCAKLLHKAVRRYRELGPEKAAKGFASSSDCVIS